MSEADPSGNAAAEAQARSVRRRRAMRILWMLLPAISTLCLATLLVFTIFFTLLDWQWIAFLSGVLVAAILSLVSSSWKAQWRMTRRTAQLTKVKERLSAEISAHRDARAQLEREVLLHRQTREQMGREANEREVLASRFADGEAALRMLARYMPIAACFLDRDLLCRFHSKLFAILIGKYSLHIDGHPAEEIFSSDALAALRPALEGAQVGRGGLAEMAIRAPAGREKLVIAELFPHRDTVGAVTGVLIVFREKETEGKDEFLEMEAEREAVGELAGGLLVTDEAGQAVYLSSLTEELTGWGDPQTRIRNAIAQDGFDLHVQEIIALQEGAAPPRMLELLIRMRDEEEHHLPPGAFFPAAEHFGLMPDIDRWVVRRIASSCASMTNEECGSLPQVCINIARSTMADQAFPGFVRTVLDQYGIAGHLLCFEIADGDVIAATGEAVRFARAVKEHGCRVSLDGFGSAGVGFGHVRSLPLDFLKIDGRIILAVERDAIAAAKVTAIHRVCRGMGVRTVAEMVESEEVRSRLVSLGVEYAQGFGISRPRPLERLE